MAPVRGMSQPGATSSLQTRASGGRDGSRQSISILSPFPGSCPERAGTAACLGIAQLNEMSCKIHQKNVQSFTRISKLIKF